VIGNLSKRRLWWALAIVPAAAGFALYQLKEPATRAPASTVAVRTVAVRSGVIERTLRLTGVTAAERGANLRAPRMRGRGARSARRFRLELKELVKPGAKVRKGEVVAVFDRQYMLNRLDDHEEELAEAAADVEKTRALAMVDLAAHRQKIRAAKGEMEKAAVDLNSTAALSAIEAELLKLTFQEARLQYSALQKESGYVRISENAKIRAAELTREQSAVDTRRARANADRMVARAPLDGVAIVQETFRGGQLNQIRVGDELRSGQLYVHIVDPSSMILEAKANQVDAGRVRIGARARVRLDAFPDVVLPAHIYSIGTLAGGGGWRPSYVREVPVYLELDQVNERVIPSLSASADVILGREEADAIVPRQAIFRDKEDGKPFALVLGEDGWQKRDLELGLANHVAVVVRSGLAAGEIVATEPVPEAE
jgi:HlyD family secretion protein